MSPRPYPYLLLSVFLILYTSGYDVYPIVVLSSISVCLYYDALLLGAYMFRILSHLEELTLLLFLIILLVKSALSEINICNPAFFSLVLVWYFFLCPFTFNLSEFLYLKYCILGPIRCTRP